MRPLGQLGEGRLELVLELLISLVRAVFWGIIFLILAALLLPDRVFVKILRKVKPDLISRALFVERVEEVFDLLINRKAVIIDGGTESGQKGAKEIAQLIAERTRLEGNLFFLDLLKSLATVINFSVTHAGYGESAVCGILDQAMEYFQFYAREIHDSTSVGDQHARIDLAAGRLRQEVAGITDFLRTDKGAESARFIRLYLKDSVQRFDSFMRSEYESAKEQLARVNQILANRLTEFVGDGLR